MIEHHTNEAGELLARNHESQGFQEIYDYKGGQKRRFRLERKAEQVFNQYNAATHLFQKVYFATGLTHNDETLLRAAYWEQSKSYDQQVQVARGVLGLAFVPAVYRLSMTFKPASLVLFGGAYYFGLYQGVVNPMLLDRLQ